jgi:hypothetical protein
LSGIDEVQPGGTYTVESDEELLPGLSFPAYRRVVTLIFLRSRGGGPIVEEVVDIDPLELQALRKGMPASAPSPTTTAAISTRTTAS